MPFLWYNYGRIVGEKMDEQELNEIAERMGCAVHELWMEKRRKEKGWQTPEASHIIYGEEHCRMYSNLWCDGKAMRNDFDEKCQKCHPCMRPYSELPETEKELDRAYPAMFIKILDEMGYQIVKFRGEH